jgi:hypothetical protein
MNRALIFKTINIILNILLVLASLFIVLEMFSIEFQKMVAPYSSIIFNFLLFSPLLYIYSAWLTLKYLKLKSYWLCMYYLVLGMVIAIPSLYFGQALYNIYLM